MNTKPLQRVKRPNHLAIYSIGQKLRTLRNDQGLTLSRLRLTTAGSEEVLNVGDCIVLETDTASSWTAAPETRCRMLAVFVRTHPE